MSRETALRYAAAKSRDGLQLEAREPADRVGRFGRGERNREILDREPGRVERGDVGVVLAARRVTREHAPDRRDVLLRDELRLDRVRELAAVARLLPVVAEELCSCQLGTRHLRLARP